MRTILRLNEAAVMDSLPRCREAVIEQARREGLSSGRTADLDLIVEEILVNIIHYAYPSEPGPVHVVCRADDERLEVEVTDEGIPFDPVSAPPPDIKADMSRRKVGGLGIHLVRRLADSVRYRHEDGRNVLTVTIRKGQPRTPSE